MRFILLMAGLFLALNTGFSATQSAEAQSQDSAIQAILACQAIEDNAERLKCLDAASRRLAGETEAAPEAPSAPATLPTPTPVPSPPVSDTTERDALAAERAALAAERAALEAERATLAEAQKAEEEEERIPVWARLRQRLTTDEDIPDEFSVNIVKITKNNVGRHFFYTEEGDVWSQVEKEDFRPPRGLPASARIKRAALGSQRLVFDDGRASSTRVRPTS